MKAETTALSGKASAVKVPEGAPAEDPSMEIRCGQTIGPLFKRVVDAQPLQADVTIGAAITSRVRLKAAEDALKLAAAN